MQSAKDYLSPMFGDRSAAERAFLRRLDERSGFSLFWLDISRPLLEHLDVRRVLEIGAAEGQHTRWLIEYCRQKGGELTVIEPQESIAMQQLLTGAIDARWLKERSQTALPKLTTLPEAVFLEGDLNYATIQHDLQGLAALAAGLQRAFPLTFVSALNWPYARRDMYYEPELLPADQRHQWARAGLTPWSAGVVPRGVNAPFANAAREGGERNGVLTAVEDFIALAQLDLRLWRLPLNFGYGIVYAMHSAAATFVEGRLRITPALERFLETLELARVNDTLRRHNTGARGRTWYSWLTRFLYG